MTDTDPLLFFRKSLLSLRSNIQKLTTVNVNENSLRDDARKLVQFYFRELRAELEGLGIDGEHLELIDRNLHQVLKLSNAKNVKNTYLKSLRPIVEVISDVELQREKKIGQSLKPTTRIKIVKSHSDQEQMIISTLDQMIPPAANSYRQALIDLSEEKRVSYRGTANELRECLREVLDKLAPDEVVKKSDSFKLEQGAEGPTQKQKVRFILKSRALPNNAIKAPEDAIRLFDELFSNLTRSVYTRTSISAHISTDKTETLKLKSYVDLVLFELLAIS